MDQKRSKRSWVAISCASSARWLAEVIRWGIVGPGDIADRVMAPAMLAAPNAQLVAVAGRDRARSEAFAARHGAARTYENAAALARDPDVDAVYVATPVDRHRPDVEAVAAAG